MARTLVLDTITEPSNSGTANITLSSDTTTTMPKVDINGGAVDATTLGAAVPSSVAATTLSATGTATLATVDINGGAIDGTTLGVATPSSVAATTLSASGNATVGGTFGVTGATTLAALTAAAVTATTLDTGQGANELYDMNQNVKTDSAVTFTTVNTGQGANELYSMNQSVSSTGAAPSFYTEAGGLGIRDYYNTTNLMFRRGSCLWTQTNDSSAISYTVSSSYSLINVGIGYYALSLLDSDDAYGNVAVGYKSCYRLQSGKGNTCVGREAGEYISSGDNNICIGYNSGTSSAPSGNLQHHSDAISLGDDDIENFFCAETSIDSSDGRDKTDVKDFTGGLDWIEAMRPVTYHWDKRSWYKEVDEETGEVISQSEPDGAHKKDKKNIGFIAQEVLEIEKAHGFANNKNDMLTVNLNVDDTAYGLKYARLVPVLVNAVKELSAKVKALESA